MVDAHGHSSQSIVEGERLKRAPHGCHWLGGPRASATRVFRGSRQPRSTPPVGRPSPQVMFNCIRIDFISVYCTSASSHIAPPIERVVPEL